MIFARSLGRIVAAAAGALIVIGCSSTQSAPTTALSEGSNVVDAPRYFVHETWLMTDGLMARVVQIERDGAAILSGGLGFVRCGASCTYRWKDGVLEEAWQASPPSPRNLVLTGSGWKFLDFPLSVGKRWHSSGVGTVQGNTRLFSINARVWSYEPVRTKAGTFMAFRLTYEWNGITPDFLSTHKQVVWYAPAVKFPVKLEATGGGWELLTYSIQ